MSPDLNWVKQQRVCLGTISSCSLLAMSAFNDSMRCKGIHNDSTSNCNGVMKILAAIAFCQQCKTIIFNLNLAKSSSYTHWGHGNGDCNTQVSPEGENLKFNTVQILHLPPRPVGGGLWFQLTSA